MLKIFYVLLVYVTSVFFTSALALSTNHFEDYDNYEEFIGLESIFLLEERWLFAGGFAIVRGRDDSDFNENGFAITAGKTYPLEQLTREESDALIDVSLTLFPSYSRQQFNQLCVIGVTRQSCSVSTSINTYALSGSVIFLTSYDSFLAFSARGGASIVYSTTEQIAKGTLDSDKTSESLANITSIVGAGLLFANTLLLEYILHAPLLGFGGNVDSATDPAKKIKATRDAYEIRISYLF